ncbi:heme-degrading monooxygenase HmoA [Spinactinospora alkalitolerans]|uniref:Heme-degrading monooxygenase HmoA n=1 Tax=Spinactinospora alkalitolerans TaxID=687207 RepID=A0A852TP70_9ACTN|nr:antibiotic biosynthesis monooxygenase [Spinactinospora alkalitolerans]NYE45405.1 heme-degrading monooxygenase HmoA [Spinactinospora alkalitolerans]
MSEVRVLVYHQAGDAAGVEAAYHRVSARMRGVPGLLGNELLRSVTDATGFVVLSRWSGIEAFQAWEAGAAHRADTTPLRPYRDTRMEAPFALYEVAASYPETGP